ncbi:Predicted exporter [Chromobacterium violaceum]|uniref:Predicted exporter n=1 Tax=Chromobacterium violaceum TaxID=536 RepID=A0A3S5DLG6_CHRVL|nr:Predicted exporter [Chromobacterium violaceum]
MDAWLAAPVSEPLRAQWLGRFGGGYASVVMLRGLASPSMLPSLAQVAQPAAGVRFIDKVGEISGLMKHYRQLMSWVIAASYLLVLAMLWRRFGRRAWRALLPTLIASVLAVALLSLCGQPIQLFTVLALLLILGMGVDYGVFLLADDDPRAFLSVTLAAAGTLLAFGLLALSSTPALAAFGLTMLLGISLCWLINPLFTQKPRTRNEETMETGSQALQNKRFSPRANRRWTRASRRRKSPSAP